MLLFGWRAFEKCLRNVRNRLSNTTTVDDVRTPGSPLRIWIKRLPHDRQLEGFDLRSYEPERVYDVGAPLADLLIVMGYAVVEMRRVERDVAADGPRRRPTDRKRVP
jgi:hypothetical protein